MTDPAGFLRTQPSEHGKDLIIRGGENIYPRETREELPTTPTGKISRAPRREETGHWAMSK